MTCDEVAERLDKYFDEEIASADQEAMSRHLAECCRCRSFYDLYAGGILLAREGADEDSLRPLPDALVQRLLARLQPERDGSS